MSQIRRTALIRLLVMAGAVLFGILPFAHATKPQSYIPIVAIFIILSQFIPFVGKSQRLVDDLFPPKEKDEEKSASAANQLVYRIGIGLLFIGLIALIFIFDTMSNTIGATKLFWSYATVGFVLYLVVIIYFKVAFPSLFYESSRRFSVYGEYLIGIMALVPAIAICINTDVASPMPFYKTVIVTSKNTAGARSTSYNFYCNYNGNEEKFTVRLPFYNLINPGSRVILQLRHGKLGYDFVEDFKLADTLQ